VWKIEWLLDAKPHYLQSSKWMNYSWRRKLPAASFFPTQVCGRQLFFTDAFLSAAHFSPRVHWVMSWRQILIFNSAMAFVWPELQLNSIFNPHIAAATLVPRLHKKCVKVVLYLAQQLTGWNLT
jgi:hypothetical protein